MKKNLIIVGILLASLLGGVVFGWDFFVPISNQSNIPRLYNPVSGFYEPKSQEEIDLEVISRMDLYSDDSLQKLLDDNHPLSANYNAKDIVNINSDFTFNRSSNFSLRKEAAEKFAAMARAFSHAFNFKAKLSINSARRSPTYQRQLASNCSVGRCAKPGTSEHEAGLALDLGVNGGNIKAGNGMYYQWLLDNAHKYGFHNSYQKGIDIDGKIIEPRHWRYVGVDLATILHNNNQSFIEYFYKNIEPKK